ncbi:MAG: FAD:protein FMN transferase [Acidobacteriota bacterium]|nr:FAD:protein FMN transferase [Acidobacteriota bacterium]
MSDRRLPRIAVAVTVAVTCTLSCVEPVREERRWTVMGTYATATIYHRTEQGAEEFLEAVRDAFEAVDRSMSNWQSDSALNAVNRGAAAAPYVVEDPELYRCIKIALEYGRTTGGAFDPTVGPLVDLWGFRTDTPAVPDVAAIEETLRHVGWEKVELIKVARAIRFRDPRVRLDLGGIAKGYALDVAARAFAQSGTVAGLLDLGGGMYAWKAPPGADSWRVGIRDPDVAEGVMATVELVSRAIATAGNYENVFDQNGESFGHIFSPRTGRPARTDILSATAIADAGVDADALSTAMFVAGSRGSAEILRNARRIEAVLLVEGRSGLEVLASASLQGQLALDPEFVRRTGASVRYLLPPQSIADVGVVTRFGEED